MNPKKERILIGSLVFTLTLCFSLFYLNRYIVDNFMWNEFNAILYHNGQFPYRDFFLYVPPAHLLKIYLAWYLFGENLIGIVIAGIVERTLMMTLFYAILSKWAKPIYAFVGTMFSFFILLNEPFDTVGDYSWMCITLTYICVYCLQYFFENRYKHPRSALVFLSLAFFFGVLSVMTKQYGLGTLLVIILLMIIYSACSRGRRLGWNALAAGTGLVVGAAPWLIWLGANGALRAFFDQVFISSLNSKGVAGNGAEGTTLFNSIRSIFSWQYTLIFLLAILIYVIHDYYKKDAKKRKIVLSVAAGAIALIILIELIQALIPCKLFDKTIPTSGVFLLTILAMAIIAARYLLGKTRNAVSTVAVISVGIILTWALIVFSDYNLRAAIISTNVIFHVGSVFSHATLMVCLAPCFRCTINGWLGKAADSLLWQRFSLIVGGLSLAFCTIVGSGTVNYMGAVCFVTVPFLLCEAFRLLEPISITIRRSEKRVFHIRNCQRALLCFCAVLLCMMSCFVMAGKIQSPYSWWGVNAGEINDKGSYTIDHEMYDGFLVSKATKTRYEQIGKLIEENSDPDDFILTFPYSVIYKIQTERYEAPTKVCIYFFDVCSDEMAISDLEIIKENPPKIIVWMDLGEECWRVHEYYFRGGNRMGQRDIQDWFNEVKDTQYELIGNVENEYVYRIKDGTPINYSYYATDNDLTSKKVEVEDNIRNSDYLRKLTSKITGTPTDRVNALYVVVTVILLVLALFGLVSGLPFWKALLILFGALYLILPCKPPLLSIYFAPLIIMLSSADPRDKKNWPWIGGMLGTVLLCLLGWWQIWTIWAQYVALVLVCAMMLCAMVQSVPSFLATYKERRAQKETESDPSEAEPQNN